MTFTPRIVRSVQCIHTQFFRGRGCSVRSQARASRRHWRAVLSRKRRSKRRARFRCLRDSPATARRHSCLWLRTGNSSAWSSARIFACYTWPRSAAGKLPICHWATSYWSPKSDRLVWSRGAENNSQEFLWTITINPQTGTPIGSAQRISVGPGSSPSISLDGKWVAYQSGDRSDVKTPTTPCRHTD